jgi:NADPH:quinone reductase-like Zn-dependent oxidoreductase
MQNFGLLREDTSIAALRAIPIPELRPGYLLVKTVAIALNPTDWTS